MLVLHDAGALADEHGAARSLSAALASLPPTSGVVLLGLPDEMASLFKTTPGLSAAVPCCVTLPALTAAQAARKVGRALAVSPLNLSLVACRLSPVTCHV